MKALKHLSTLAILTLAAGAAPGGAASDLPFELSEYEGKVVIVDFWASWCVPCRRSFPWLNEMHERYADDGLVIVGVNLDHERAEAQRFLDEFPARFRIVYEGSKALAKSFDVIGMPSSYLIGRDGETRKRHIGFKVRKQDEYEAAILAALNDKE